MRSVRGCPPVTRYPCPQAEECPGCHNTDQVRSAGNTLNTEAWACDGCGMGWAVSLVNPHVRDRAGDHAEEVGRLRWYLQQIVALGDDAPKLTDRELRDRLLTLASGAR